MFKWIRLKLAEFWKWLFPSVKAQTNMAEQKHLVICELTGDGGIGFNSQTGLPDEFRPNLPPTEEVRWSKAEVSEDDDMEKGYVAIWVYCDNTRLQELVDDGFVKKVIFEHTDEAWYQIGIASDDKKSYSSIKDVYCTTTDLKAYTDGGYTVLRPKEGEEKDITLPKKLIDDEHAKVSTETTKLPEKDGKTVILDRKG